MIDIKLANPRGFCAGVDRAIEIVLRALDLNGAPIYVRHEVVHNKSVVEMLRKRGAIFVDDISDIPDNVTVIFSAHGVSQAVRKQASKKNLKIFDATCPLVTKVHTEVSRSSLDGADCIMIGHHEHPEVEGTMGQYENKENIYLVENASDATSLKIKNPSNVAYVTQTTLSVDDTAHIIDILRNRFPLIKGPKKDDICYATQNRQDAVKQLALECDLVLVVGSTNSSNSNRLKELAERCGVQSFLVDNAADISEDWIVGKKRIGITAGASAPESLVQEVIESIKLKGCQSVVEIFGAEENIKFSIPKELR